MKRPSMIPGCLLAWAALSLWSAAAAASPPLERSIFEDGAALAADSEGAVALAHMLDVAAVDAWVSIDVVLPVLDDVANTAVEPRVRDLAAYLALRRVQAEGEVHDIAAREEAMGFVTSWALIGPFPNDGMAGLTARYGPELDGVDRAAEYDGKVVPVRWREINAAADTGYVDLTPRVQPSWSAAAYLAADIEVARSTDATLALAVDGAYRVWLDGEPLAEQDQHLGGWLMRDEIPVRLSRGRHQLLIKVAVDDSSMGLHARLLDADGAPLDVQARPAERAGIVAAQTDAWPTAPTMADGLLLDEGATASELAAAAAVIASFQAADPDDPWMPLVERALAGDPDAQALRRLAGVVPEHWRRVELLERALELAPDDPVIRLDLASALYEEMGEASRSRGMNVLRELVDEQPMFGRARLLQAQTLLDIGLYYAHLEAMFTLADELDGAPPLRAELLAAIERMRRDELTVAAARDAWMADRASIQQTRRYVDALRAAGRADEARAVVTALLDRRPQHVAAIELAADQDVADGDLRRAVERLTEALALSPGDAILLRRRAELHIELGDNDGAAADFEAALARSPQDSEVRDYLARISPDVDAFWDAWRIDVDGLLELRDASDPVDDVEFEYLVDQRIIHVYPNGLATTYVQQAFDVRTRNGADALRATSLVYSPDSEVVDIVAVRVIKPDGSVREVYDSRDRGPGSGPSSIYYDVRSRSLFFPTLEEGDVLSYEYTIADVSYRNIFDDYFGDMMFVQAHQPKTLVRWAALMPSDRPLHTNEATLEVGTWTSEDRGDERLVLFEARDVPRIEREANSPGAAERFAYLSASTYEQWDALADWYWHLVEEQLVLSPDIERTVAELIDGVDDPREQVSAIHEYVVRNTRYVGLEFGIHGFKPYRTSDCFQRRFGDCKDTASLMKVMLEAAGIDAHLVLVRTRDLGNIDDHPPSLAVFNHAITYVPAYDLYLDGTAGFSGSDELPTLDQGASAVIVLDGEGGRFLRIAELPADGSTRTSRVQVSLDAAGASGSGELVLTGSFAPGMRRAYESADQPVEQFSQELASNMPGLRVTDASFSDMTDITVPVQIDYVFEGGDWASSRADGTRVVHPLGGDADLAGQLAGASRRTAPLELDHRFVLDERYEISVPGGWQPVSLPEAVELDTPYGALRYSVSFEEGTLTGQMRFELSVTRVDAADYDAFRTFVVDAESALNQVVRFETEER